MTTEHTPASGLAEAAAALGSALSGKPAPASPAAEPPPPAPEATPEPPPEPAAPPPTEPEPPAEPGAEPAPTPAEPPAEPPPTPTLDLSDPGARRFLEMHGGDPNKALAAALGYNNRLASLAKNHPEMFQQGGPADPRQVPEFDEPILFEEPPPPMPPTEYELDTDAIEAQVNAQVYQDATATGLIRAFMGNQQNLQGLTQEIEKHQGRIQYLEHKIEDPDLAPDDLRKSEIQSELDRLENKLSRAQTQAYMLNAQNNELNAQFLTIRGQIYSNVEGQFRQEAEEASLTQMEQAVSETEFRKIMTEFPSAVDRCVKENAIPPELAGDFRADAAREFKAAMADPDFVVDDMYSFLAPRAKAIKERLDRYHRVRSGQYATAAAQRAATPAPPTTPGTPTPPQPAADDLDAIMAGARHSWAQATRR